MALDNPDAPDYVGEFQARALSYESNIQQTVHTTQGYLAVYTTYEHFLEKELNSAYNQLMTHLDEEAQLALSNSQQNWQKYREAEFDFITINWTVENFGSASAISRGDYRTTIIKNRVMLLLYYLQNY